MNRKAIILASGKGQRMLPLTRDIPKPLLKVGNVTLLEDKIIKLAESGITDIAINTAYLGSYIHDHVGDGSKFGIQITISDEGESPIGTANGIRKILDFFGENPFLVVNADIWTNYTFIDLLKHDLSNKLGHVVLVPKPTYHQGDFSLEDNHLIKGQDFTFTGIGLYTSELFRKYSHSDLGDILREEKNISSSIFGGYWEDIGTPERLENARSAYNSL